MSAQFIELFEEKTGVQWTGITFHKIEPFGYPDSREYGGMGQDKFVIGIPLKLIRHLNDEQLVRI